MQQDRRPNLSRAAERGLAAWIAFWVVVPVLQRLVRDAAVVERLWPWRR